jgi:hypothetical protein
MTASPVPSIPVVVTNTPLPVTGSVNANIGTPTVNVASLPAVQLSGTPAVSFTNTANTPIYVDTDRAARHSFDASCDTGYDSTSGQGQCQIFTIPPGAQIVVETVACTAEVPTGQGVGQADLIVPNIPYGGDPGSAAQYYFNLAMTNQTGSSNGSSVDIWGLTNQVHIYGGAPTGGSVGVFAFYRGSASALPQGMNCNIAGYVVQP